jgi:hypothetical protein
MFNPSIPSFLMVRLRTYFRFNILNNDSEFTKFVVAYTTVSNDTMIIKVFCLYFWFVCLCVFLLSFVLVSRHRITFNIYKIDCFVVIFLIRITNVP